MPPLYPLSKEEELMLLESCKMALEDFARRAEEYSKYVKEELARIQARLEELREKKQSCLLLLMPSGA